MVSQITRFYCKLDMTSSWFLRQGSLYAILHNGFWKGDPDLIFMFNWHLLSILNGLNVIRLFLFGWEFPTAGGRNVGGFWAKWPKNVKWEKNTCWEGTSLRQTASFKPLRVWSVQVRKKKGRKEGRSHKKCIFHVCVERPLAGGFQPNLARVFVSRT